MNDLQQALERDLDRVPGPPAWEEVERRGALPELTWAPPPPRRRVGALLLAATLTAALAAGLVSVAGDEPEPPPPPVPEMPNVLRISCLGDERERVESDVVAVQSDGLHIEIVQERGAKPRRVAIGDQGMGYGLFGVADSSPDGQVSVVISSMNLAVGHLLIGCFDEDTVFAPEAEEFTYVRLRDPDDVWVSTRLACGRNAQIGSDTVDLTGVDEADIPRALLEGTEGLRPTDVIEPAGFPEPELRTFRAVRGGEVLARYEVDDTLAGFDSCEGIGDPAMWRGN